MEKRFILSLDQGTTSSKAVIFNTHSEIIAMESIPLRQIYPKPGWVEHDPIEIWKGQLEAARSAIKKAGILPAEISSIGITNQRETVILWDRYTGKPVYNAIVWQCRRSSGTCDELKKHGLARIIQERTGLVVDAYFSGTKIKWLLDNVDGLRKKANDGELLAGTIDTWIIWNLTGGRIHATDYSNASRTMLFNIRKLEWDSDLLDELQIPAGILPRVVDSSGYLGETEESILGSSIPICGIAGDQQSALFGQTCFEKGSVKSTYGTGCFILMNTGEKPVSSRNNLLTTISWGINGNIEYALEGSVFNGGASIQWLRDELKLVSSAQECDIEAEKVPDTGGVYVVPAFTGLGAPYWDMYARGAIVGMTRGTNRQHIIRATLESIAYQCRDVIEAMEADSEIKMKELRVDGGASISPFLMQFQSDILGIPVKRPIIIETTALGAAYLAGLSSGIWGNKEEIRQACRIDKTFIPQMPELQKEQKYYNWKRAVERAKDWEK
ncbi:MAG: glycerol kinase GlpK [Clostridia bacterium]|nr:glycerol kinase GlpK [Clostridia bacterium]